MKASLKLFRIAGIDIGIHYSWIFIFIFFTWTLAQNFSLQYAGWGTAAYWITGAVTSLLLFISVLIHELAHSLVARARGIPVHSITLFILGGVSNLEEEPKKPWGEFTMAIVGPAASLILGGILLVISQVINTANANQPVAAAMGYLALLNFSLGIFNLLPGFPLDGGRVLRSILWGSTGSLQKATNIASWVGQFFGWVLIGFGIYIMFGGFGLGFISGLWMAFVGWFLMSSADASRKEVTIRERLSHVKVREIMNINITTITPETSVQDMVSGIFTKRHDRAIPVCQGEQLTGIATIDDVKKVPQERWGTTPVKDIMTSGTLFTVSPDDNLKAAMEIIARNNINQVVIKDGEKCGGLLTRADIIRYIQTSQELGISSSRSKNQV